MARDQEKDKKANEGEAGKAAHEKERSLAPAVLTSLGIVYGDLGTSPLYTYPAITKAIGKGFNDAAALGSLSLIFWTLIIIVSAKYCLTVMRADNHGEGGILALMSMARASWQGRNRYYLLFGVVGAALIYGDGAITPAISVLSAVEGLDVATDLFKNWTTWIAVAILTLLFLVQRFGTAIVGIAFGPIMLIWFVTIGVLGITGIVQAPHVLMAVSPTYAAVFLAHNGLASFFILGGVFLSVTGAEAMYADMGHIGRFPIRVAWFALVLPALLLNYAGQTAVALSGSQEGGKPFFHLAPGWALYPLVGLATLATIIASQAIITGSFSMTRQAMQLGWLPGFHIRQTSAAEYGQIYVPVVNWMMMIATLLLAIAFGSSERLAGAYGTAVATTMLLTTMLLYRIMIVDWHWENSVAIPVFAGFLIVDFVFFAANLLKIADGGWIPLTIATLITIVMVTWRTGAGAMRRMQSRDMVTIGHFKRQLRNRQIMRIKGKAIFLTRLTHYVPPLIADHIRQMGTLYSDVVAMTVQFANRPRLKPDERIHVRHVGTGVWHINVQFGFIENPDVPRALHAAKTHCPFDLDGAVYFSEQDKIVSRKRKPRLARWRRWLFSFLYRNSVHPADRFDLPSDNFVQVRRQIEI